MNIDKIYKPLKRYVPFKDTPFFEIYSPSEVEELEEKYKELLEDYILIVNSLISDWVCS